MTISEKSAYLKGLMDGLKLNTESDEGKMIAAIVDLLGDVTKKVVDIEDTTIAISDELDEIEEDLDAIEDYILDEEDDYDEDDDDDWSYDEDEDEDSEEGFDFGDEETTVYEVQCACGNIIDFDEDVLESGSIVCDKCGETLEFSFEDEDEEYSHYITHTRGGKPLRFLLYSCSTQANWNLAGSPIVGNGLAHSVGEAAFCRCLCCENCWVLREANLLSLIEAR